MSALLGAMEAGGTKFVCAASKRGEILAQTRISTDAPEVTLAAARQFFETVIAEHGELSALGIAAFGPLDLRNGSPTYGHLLATPKHGWAGTDLVAPFARRFGCAVSIDTDVNAAAIAETSQGAARGCRTAVYVTVGTGIGGGVVSSGRPVHGLMHPELGHVRIPHDLQRDPYGGSCPYHGDCFEGLACGPAIQQRWGVPGGELPDDHPAWALEADYLASGMVALACILSPHKIVLSGGVGRRPGMPEAVATRLEELLADYMPSPQIVAPVLGDRAGVLGALALAMSTAYSAT